MSACYTCLKYLAIFVNFLLSIVGIGFVALATWMLSDPNFSLSVTQNQTDFMAGTYSVLAAGVVLFLVGIIGCFGIVQESPCLLITYFCLLLIILVSEIAAGVWVYTNKAELESMMKENMQNTVKNEYGVLEYRTATFDAIQKHLKCCGANGPADWSASRYNKVSEEKAELNMGVTFAKPYKIPLTCCASKSPVVCETLTKIVGASANIPDTVFQNGCIQQLKEMAIAHEPCFWIIVFAFVFLKLLGLVLSLILCCSSRSVDHYKS